MKNYPELRCYRDIIFWWKYVLNTDRSVFPNYVDPLSPREIARQSRMNAQLSFDWDQENNGYRVIAMGTELHCAPDPKKVNPMTGKPIAPESMPTHRFPSTATPSFYVPAPAIKTEDDIIYRPNLPGFEDRHGQVLNQRDSELLLSYLTVPYLRLPLIITFFSTEDRIHKLQSSELRLILDSVLFEPGIHLHHPFYLVFIVVWCGVLYLPQGSTCPWIWWTWSPRWCPRRTPRCSRRPLAC